MCVCMCPYRRSSPLHSCGPRSSRRSWWRRCHSPWRPHPSQSPATDVWNVHPRTRMTVHPHIRMKNSHPHIHNEGHTWVGCGNRSSYPSPFDSVSKQPDHIVALGPRSLETLGPVQQDSLRGGEERKRTQSTSGSHSFSSLQLKLRMSCVSVQVRVAPCRCPRVGRGRRR